MNASANITPATGSYWTIGDVIRLAWPWRPQKSAARALDLAPRRIEGLLYGRDIWFAEAMQHAARCPEFRDALLRALVQENPSGSGNVAMEGALRTAARRDRDQARQARRENRSARAGAVDGVKS